MYILEKIAWILMGFVIAMAILLGLPSCVSMPKAPVCQAVQILSPDGKVAINYALPNDPGASFINSKTEWLSVAVLGPSNDYLLLAAYDPKDSSMIWFLLVQAVKDSLVPIILTLEDQKQLAGERFVKAWWYGGDGSQCPESVSKAELVKRLKARMGLSDGSV